MKQRREIKVALRKVTECVSGVKVRRVTALVVVSALLCFEAKHAESNKHLKLSSESLLAYRWASLACLEKYNYKKS